MKRYSAAKARQELSHVLDAAERGEGVVIERAGVLFEVKPVRSTRPSKPRVALIESLDPALEHGTWTWELGAQGLSFKKRARRA